MKGMIHFDSRARTMAFAAHLSSYVNSELLRVYDCARQLHGLFQGKSTSQAQAGVKRLRRIHGRETVETVAARMSPEGTPDWLFSFEDGLLEASDVRLHRPSRPHTHAVSEPIIKDGFWVKFEANNVRIEGSSSWAKNQRSDMANSLDAAALTWRWGPGESGLILDGNDCVRCWGNARKDLFAVSPAA